jgi:hypothetical protein
MTVQNYLLMTWEKLPRRKVYTDVQANDIVYIADADHWTVLTDAKRKVQKLLMVGTGATATLDEIWETDNYDNLASDLATVQWFSYS